MKGKIGTINKENQIKRATWHMRNTRHSVEERRKKRRKKKLSYNRKTVNHRQGESNGKRTTWESEKETRGESKYEERK